MTDKDLSDLVGRIAEGIANDASWPLDGKVRRDAADALDALVAEVERLRGEVDALARTVGQAVVAASLAAGETLADPIPHIIVSTVTRLRAEALGQRAVNAEIGALAYAYGAEAERAAAVAYLRYHAEVFVADERALCRAANDIERGDHVTEVKS